MSGDPQLCKQYGFDRSRRQSRLALLDLGAADKALARQLHERVIAPHVSDIVAVFYERMGEDARFNEILQRGFDVKELKRTQAEYMLTLGLDFEEAAYFESRLRVGLAHERVGVPLSLYQCAYRLLQQLIIDRIRQEVDNPNDAQALCDFVLKIANLDMSLAIETYHRYRLHTLEDSLEAVHSEEESLRQRAQTDALTGAANRDWFFQTLRLALENLKRDANDVCLVMADLDFFKQVNDAHGHVVGDRVLQDVAGRIHSAVRDFDVVGRYGGEEFVVLLQNTPRERARQVAERIRERVGGAPINVQGLQIAMTISLGFTLAEPGEEPNQLIDRADRAMYAAKEAGRNCVMAYDDVAGR